MPKLFGVDIAKEIADAMGSLLLSAKLIKVTASSSTSNSTEGSTTESSSACRGVLEDYKDSQVDGTIVLQGDRKVLLLGATLPTGVIPTPNDKIEIEDTQFIVIRVQRDPAAASYTCQVRL